MQHYLRYISLTAILISTFCRSQNFISYDFQKAVENNTRTLNGVPGVNYFQNRSEYILEVDFNPTNGNLKGKASIKYFNNSPDTLRKLVFRVYQNVNKEGGIRDNEVDPSAIHNGVEISSMNIDGFEFNQSGKHKLRYKGTNLFTNLSKPLLPGSSIFINVEWSFTMPQSAMHRYGKYGESNYFVGYWYPQISVYDDIDGWDEMNYTDTHEFYNDFNSHDVKITVPKQFLVWATGEWQNADKTLSEKILERLALANENDEKIEIITEEDLESKDWMQSGKAKTYHFTAGNVPDFAFAVSDKYIWDATSVMVDSVSKRRVLVQAAYRSGAKYFDQVAEIGREAIQHMSFSSYGIPYPYPVATVFNGEGGMEYPMMVNNSARMFLGGTVFLTMHELAHAYFPFMMGINERKHSWIDEGLTTYLPMETEIALKSNYYSIESVITKYTLMAGTDSDVPLYVSAYQTRGDAYQYYTYFRSTVAFYLLEQYIGREAFRSGIQQFMYSWQYKHPAPYDLFACLKNSTDKDIDWFIDQWFYQAGWPDLAIGEVKMTGSTLKVGILKKGNFAVPIEIIIRYREAEDDLLKFRPDVWKEKDSIVITHQIIDEVESISINGANLPDKDRTDNYFKFPEPQNP